MKLIEVKAIKSKAKIVNINIPEKIKIFLLDNFHNDLKYLEKNNKVKINLIGDKSLLVPEYEMTFENKSKKILEKIEHKIEIKKVNVENKNNVKNFERKKNFKKKKFFKKRKIK